MTVSVNGIAVAVDGAISTEMAAVRELLRQRAVAVGLLDDEATDDEKVARAIEALLEREVATPAPTEAECRRHYEQHPEVYGSGDLVHARHILFQVTPRVNVAEIRTRAESALNELLREPDRFAAMAAELSNCPSGQHGGNLGQIGRGDMVPEFEKALFRLDAVGLLPELVKTRFGFHIVAVDRSIPGDVPPFEAVQTQVAEKLRNDVEERALRQYVSILASQAKIVGAHIEAATSPLVQ
jgi:peptidyl-prolyl cis-trans isomerase C